MKEESLARVFFRHLLMAVPWGIVFFIVFFVTFAAMKQQVKEGIQYGIRAVIYETKNFSIDYKFPQCARNAFRAEVEFVTKTAGNELKDLLNDTQVKESLKEIIKDTEG